ncbi:MAG: FAD-binding oxidoreductase [Chitinophagales bacterium]
MITERNNISGWGNYPVQCSDIFTPENEEELQAFLVNSEKLTPRGNGRSYGDSAIGRNTLKSSKLNKILDFNSEDGTITCQSGVLLSSILNVIVPHGYFLAVTPGTKYVSVGGATASDVHGKNHNRKGNFSKHITYIKLLLSSGETLLCSPTLNQEVFWASCGGMGQTGFIIEVCLKLQKIETAYMVQHNIRCFNLKEVFNAFSQFSNYDYRIAWIDSFQKSKKLGRGVFTGANHCSLDMLSIERKTEPFEFRKKNAFAVPFMMPSFLLNGFFVRILNLWRWKKAPTIDSKNVVCFEDLFFPLDSVLDWHKLYGPKGFVQYQFALPLENAEEGIEQILQIVSNARDNSLLTVIKQFGKSNENTLLSFPMEGYTASLDFKVSATLFPLLEKLDEIVLQFGGRLYLTKDARMNLNMMIAGYPRLKEFQDILNTVNSDNKFTSAQRERINY